MQSWDDYGNDLNGGSGADIIVAGDNGDTVHGNADDDIIVGGLSSDVIFGGDGHDTIFAGFGSSDVIDAGDGNDRIVLDSALGAYVITGDGQDDVWLKALSTPDPGYDYNIGPQHVVTIEADDADRLFWKGYQLTGGFFTILGEDPPGEVSRRSVGWLDSHGIIYEKASWQTDMTITLPDNSVVIVKDYEDGDFGFLFDPAPPNTFIGPRSNIAGYGYSEWRFHIDELDGRADALAFDGVNAPPEFVLL